MMKRKIETEKTVLTLWVIGKHQELPFSMTYLSQLDHKYYLHKVLKYNFKYFYVSFTSHKESQ